MALEDRKRRLALLVHESLDKIGQVRPFVRALVEQPGRDDLFLRAAGPCCRLFHFVQETGGPLGLNHLTAPAGAMEYLLDRVQSGILLPSPPHIALLAESCAFLERGLVLVRREGTDARLASSAAVLAAAIRRFASGERTSVEGKADAALFGETSEAFLRETEDLLTTVEQECVLWDFIAIDLERVADVSRLLHRLQQTFALYGFRDPERICRALESALNRYVQGEVFQTEYPERIFLRCIDAIRAAITAFPFPAGDLAVSGAQQLLAAIQGMMRRPIGQLLIEAGLVGTGTVEHALAVQRSSHDAQPRRLGELLVAMGEVTPEQVQHVLQKQGDKRARFHEADAVPGPGGRCFSERLAAALSTHGVCVDGRRLKRMSAVLTQLTALCLPEKHGPLLAELHTLVQSCHRDALAFLTGHLQKVVYDLSVQGNKRVHFTIEGIEALQEAGEMTVLADSLAHLLRNSMVHGLESGEERLRSGKRQAGRLHLSVSRQGEEIWLSVEDDGQGFDCEQVAALIVGRGLATADRAGRMTCQERIRHLLKEPSAVQCGKQAAGSRVPGLLAVSRVLQGMQGSVNVATRPGKGARVTLQIPRER